TTRARTTRPTILASFFMGTPANRCDQETLKVVSSGYHPAATPCARIDFRFHRSCSTHGMDHPRPADRSARAADIVAAEPAYRLVGARVGFSPAAARDPCRPAHCRRARAAGSGPPRKLGTARGGGGLPGLADLVDPALYPAVAKGGPLGSRRRRAAAHPGCQRTGNQPAPRAVAGPDPRASARHLCHPGVQRALAATAGQPE